MVTGRTVTPLAFDFPGGGYKYITPAGKIVYRAFKRSLRGIGKTGCSLSGFSDGYLVVFQPDGYG